MSSNDATNKAIKEFSSLAEFLARVAAVIESTPKGPEGIDFIAKALDLDLAKELKTITPLAENQEAAEAESKQQVLSRTNQLSQAIERKITKLYG